MDKKNKNKASLKNCKLNLNKSKRLFFIKNETPYDSI